MNERLTRCFLLSLLLAVALESINYLFSAEQQQAKQEHNVSIAVHEMVLS